MLVLVAVGWLAGLLLSSLAPPGPWLPLAALALASLSAYVLHGLRARLWSVPLAALAFTAGLGAAPRPPTYDVPQCLSRADARVLELQHTERSTVAIAELEGGACLDDGRALPIGARVRLLGVDVAPGARLRSLLELRPEARFRNPTPHPPWLGSRGVDSVARPRSSPRLLDEPWLSGVLHEARGRLRRRIDDTLPARSAAMTRALLLGDGSAVRPEERDALREAGLAHLLAVSGLHVGLVVMVVVVLARALLRGRVRDAGGAAALLAAPLAIGFALMAGGGPSAWRAAAMTVVACGLRAMRRRARGLEVAAAATIVFSVLDPEAALRPAFLLSIAATTAIVTSPIEGSSLRLAWRISWRSTVSTAPLVIWCFGALPPLGVLANVILVPVSTLLLVLCFVHAVVAGAGLGAWTAPLVTGAVDALTAAAEPLGWGNATLPPPSIAQGLVLTFAAFALLSTHTARRQVAIAVAGSIALVTAEAWLRHVEKPTGGLRVTYVDVGQGDGALVDLPDGRLMLIDAGGGMPDPGERALLPLLRARRRDRIDVAVISHPHPDHFGGLVAVMKEVEVVEIWDSGQAEAEAPHGVWSRLLRSARRRGVRVRAPPELCRTPQRFGSATVHVMWPCGGFDAGYGPNDNSLVVRIDLGARRFLFTGDVESLAEAELVSRPEALRADVLKVPHHGSRTSSGDAFLRAVAPLWAVASAGRQNRFGHPHPEVTERYAAHGVALLRTDRSGGVVAVTDGRQLRVEGYSSSAQPE